MVSYSVMTCGYAYGQVLQAGKACTLLRCRGKSRVQTETSINVKNKRARGEKRKMMKTKQNEKTTYGDDGGGRRKGGGRREEEEEEEEEEELDILSSPDSRTDCLGGMTQKAMTSLNDLTAGPPRPRPAASREFTGTFILRTQRGT